MGETILGLKQIKTDNTHYVMIVGLSEENALIQSQAQNL